MSLCSYPAPLYATGAEIGVYIDLEARVVGFSKDGHRLVADCLAASPPPHPLRFDASAALRAWEERLADIDADIAARSDALARDADSDAMRARRRTRAVVDELRACAHGEGWTAFAMLDKEDDTVTVLRVFRGREAARAFAALPEATAMSYAPTATDTDDSDSAGDSASSSDAEASD